MLFYINTNFEDIITTLEVKIKLVTNSYMNVT